MCKFHKKFRHSENTFPSYHKRAVKNGDMSNALGKHVKNKNAHVDKSNLKLKTSLIQSNFLHNTQRYIKESLFIEILRINQLDNIWTRHIWIKSNSTVKSQLVTSLAQLRAGPGRPLFDVFTAPWWPQPLAPHAAAFWPYVDLWPGATITFAAALFHAISGDWVFSLWSYWWPWTRPRL